MSTSEIINQLVKEISSLSSALSDLDAILKGCKGDRIWSVMHFMEGDTPNETFNCCFDALFREDYCDSCGCLHYIHHEKQGMGLTITYLSKIDWAKNFPLDLVEIKLQHLIIELKHLQ